MKVITSLQDFSSQGKFVSVALGNFDGVHIGHQHIIKQLVNEAKRKNGISVVFTFEPHPLKVLNQANCPQLLTRLEDKQRIISNLHVDFLLLYPFNLNTAQMIPDDFVKEILIKGLGAKHVFVGFNFTFGRKAQGTAETLKEICANYGCEVTIFPPVMVDGVCVSSTRVRECLTNGRIKEGNMLLGSYYQIKGTVVHGDKIGRDMGFPTANLAFSSEIIVPANGVYAVKVLTREGVFDGVANIGCRPTIGNNLPRTIEIHILERTLNIYNQEIKVFFVDRLRDEIRFSGKEQLAHQIYEDVERAKFILNSFNLPIVK
ncbi:MAG: bifunctional riboflavin kinase/FAD synthetase [Bacillota bacterium]|jgi:riboflavin kinase/FMN adenylyltransferase|nr:bifunctional riboflavin kinase/FAD synthetase [Clostridia bacterium]